MADFDDQAIADAIDEVDRVIDEIGTEAVSIARTLVPVASGRLRDSIRSYRVGDEVFVEADTEYALAIEFGTRDTDKQPFLFPAVRKAGRKVTSK